MRLGGTSQHTAPPPPARSRKRPAQSPINGITYLPARPRVRELRLALCLTALSAGGKTAVFTCERTLERRTRRLRWLRRMGRRGHSDTPHRLPTEETRPRNLHGAYACARAGSMFKLFRARISTALVACGGCARSLNSPLAIWWRCMQAERSSGVSPRSQLLMALSHSRRRPTGHRWRSVTASQDAIRKKRARNARCASAVRAHEHNFT